MYKLVVTVGAARIYALVRGSVEAARQKLRETLSTKADAVLASGRVVFLVGDVAKPRLGLSTADYIAIQRSVSIIINASANIKFRDPLESLVSENCLSALELAALGMGMLHLRCFVHVSTAYVSSFRKDGVVEERIYEFGDPEREIRQLLQGERPTRAHYYAWPYAYSKHLAEQLLTRRFPTLPLLVLRPTSIGPALYAPFPQYLPRKSCPMSNVYARFLASRERQNTWYVPDGVPPGSNFVDEIPVDLVVNMALQHVHRGTRGVVHAASGLYIRRTLNDYLGDIARHAPPGWGAGTVENVFTSDKSQRQCLVADFYRIGTRNWDFSTLRSLSLDATGPIGLSIEGHNADAYVETRLARVISELRSTGTKGNGKLQDKTDSKL